MTNEQKTEPKKGSYKKTVCGCLILFLVAVAGFGTCLHDARVKGKRARLDVEIRGFDSQMKHAVERRGDVYLNLPKMWGTAPEFYLSHRLKPLHGLDRITSVSLSEPNQPFTVEGMTELASLPDLKRLFFQDTPFKGNDVFETLFDAKTLTDLEFQNCSFDGRALVSLQKLSDKRPELKIRHCDFDRRIFW